MSHILKEGALKSAYNDSNEKNQCDLKNKINKLMKSCDVKYQIGSTRLNEILNDKIDNVRLHEGLALATIFDTFLSDFIEDNVLALGSFEVKLIKFDSGIEFDEQLLEQEINSRERICTYATFPSYPYYQFADPNGTPTEQAFYKINEERFRQIKNGNIRTFEYFTLDSYLNFLFSPVSRMSKENKVNALERMLKIFDKNITPHKLYFFSSS